MADFRFPAATWIAPVLIATLGAIWFRISTPLAEIMVGIRPGAPRRDLPPPLPAKVGTKIVGIYPTTRRSGILGRRA